tara:strand:+ start:506 stop:1369 length:864 start_codon:yes stop_codon:yes gene_type:complete
MIIKKDSTFYDLIKFVEKNFFLKPKTKKFKEIDNSFINFFKKRIKKKIISFKLNNSENIKIPLIKMGKTSSFGLFIFLEFIVFYLYDALKKKNKRAADIGGNLGLHSIIMSKLGYKVDVYEPDPNHFKILAKNITNNNCKRINLINKAVLDKNSKMQFVQVLNNTFANHIIGEKDNAHGKLKVIDVQALDISKIVNKYSFLKIDAEGSEGKIICRLNKTQLKKVDIICEISGKTNAKVIFDHCKKNSIHIFSQKIKWNLVKKLNDIPHHHSDGLIFISSKKNILNFR